MRVKVDVKVKDVGLKKFFDTAYELNTLGHVKVGVLDDGGPGSAANGALTVAQIAAINEFGNGRIPERSFMRSTFNKHRQKYVNALKRMIKEALLGRLRPVQTLQLLGLRLATDMKNTVAFGDGVPPPNAPMTIANKGSAHTLIDTGRMLAAITWAYVTRGGR